MKDSNLYQFNKEVINEELINLLRHQYHSDYATPLNVERIHLVPAREHFMRINNNSKWYYDNLIIVTKEQVDRFLLLNNLTEIKFIDFINNYKE